MGYPYYHLDVELSQWRNFRHHYDMEQGTPSSHPPLFVCHQMISNAIFEADLSPVRQLQGIYITSEHQKHKALYGIRLTAIIQLFNEASDHFE